MKILKWICFAHWAAASLAAVYWLETSDLLVLAVAISAAIVGVLFLAFERVISLLTDIRDAIDPTAEERKRAPAEKEAERYEADEAAREEAWKRLEAGD